MGGTAPRAVTDGGMAPLVPGPCLCPGEFTGAARPRGEKQTHSVLNCEMKENRLGVTELKDRPLNCPISGQASRTPRLRYPRLPPPVPVSSGAALLCARPVASRAPQPDLTVPSLSATRFPHPAGWAPDRRAAPAHLTEQRHQAPSLRRSGPGLGSGR